MAMMRNKTTRRGVKLTSTSLLLFLGAIVFVLAWITTSTFPRDAPSTSNSPSSISERSQKKKNPVSMRARQLDPGSVKPFSCPALLEKAKLGTLNFTEPNDHRVYTRWTNTDPGFWVSLHDGTFDQHRWTSIMEQGHYYEKKLTNVFVEILRSTSAPARVLDVGGNIGFFSLVSAATGPFKIDTFEPNMANVLRFCESLWLNDWHSEYESPDEHHAAHEHHDDDQSHALVNLYNMGVGDTNGLLHFYENAKNPGRGKFEMPAHYEEGGAMPSPYDLNVITLDHFAEERGWFESKPDIAILKVDVEGLENKVIIGAAKLIQARLIHNILMEITVKNDDDKKDLRPVLELIVKAGYKLHKYGGFLGPGNLSKLPHDDQLIDTIMDKCQTGTHGQLNLWWKIMD